MINREQEYYDLLKQKSNKDLIKQAKEEQVTIHNAEIRLGMIRNLLINREEDVGKTIVRDFEYHRFKGVE